MLVVKIGYTQYISTSGGAEPRDFLGLLKVQEKYINGVKKFYVAETSEEIEVTMVKDNRIVYPDDEQTIEEDTKALLKTAEKEGQRNFEWFLAEQEKVKLLEKQIAELKKEAKDA